MMKNSFVLKSIGIVVFIFIVVCFNHFLEGGSLFPKKTLTGYDIELWKDTPAWELAKAVKKNDTSKVNHILKQDGISIDYREPKFGHTLLFWAASNNQIDIVQFLLKKGADPNLHCYYDGESPIILASDYLDIDSNPEILKLLLKYRGNPNDYITSNEYVTHERSKQTPLTAASRSSLLKVKLLLEAGANIEFATKEGETPLYYATLGNHFDIIKYLLDNGADYRNVYTVIMSGDTLRFLDLLAKNPYRDTPENEELLRQIRRIVSESEMKK